MRYFVLNELQSSLIFLLYPSLLLRDRAFSIGSTETFRSLTIITFLSRESGGFLKLHQRFSQKTCTSSLKSYLYVLFSINRLQLALSCAWKIQLRFTWAEQSQAYRHPQHKVVTTRSVAGSQDLPYVYPLTCCSSPSRVSAPSPENNLGPSLSFYCT